MSYENESGLKIHKKDSQIQKDTKDMKNVAEIKRRIKDYGDLNVFPGLLCIGYDDVIDPLYDHFDVDIDDIQFIPSTGFLYIKKEFALKHNLISKKTTKDMQTEVQLTENKPQSSNITPQVGQFWKHRTGSVYQIVQIDSRYGLICVASNDVEIQGMLYSRALLNNVENVLCGLAQFFTFIPKLSLTIN